MASITTIGEAGMCFFTIPHLWDCRIKSSSNSISANREIVVARIAYLSSHTIVSVQPALGLDSEFSKYLKSCERSRLAGVVSEGHPEVDL